MVCREYPLGSVVIAQVRTGSWLTDNQVQSLFHTLSHDPRVDASDARREAHWNRRAVFDRIVERSRHDIDTNPMWRPQRREGLRARLDSDLDRAFTGLEDEQMVALERLPEAVQESQRQLRSRLQQLGARRGMSEREAMAEYVRLRAEAPAGRQNRATEVERAALGMIPADPQTRYALRELEHGDPVRPPQREVNQWLPVEVDERETNPIVEIGLSDCSDRIELRHRDGSIEAWETNEAWQAGLRGSMAEGQVAPGDARDACIRPAEGSGWRLRCDQCGQFIGTRPHQCITHNRATCDQRVTHVGGARMVFPDATLIGREFPDDVRVLAVPLEVDANGVHVEGHVSIRRGPDAINASRDTTMSVLDIDDAGLSDDLTCSQCHSTTCEHTDAARTLARQELRRGGTVPNPRRRATARAAVRDAIAQEATATEAAAPTSSVIVNEATLSLTDQPDVFRDLARQGAAEGVPFHPEDGSLTGYAAGVRFGVELEFSGNTEYDIAERLEQASILRTRGIGNYHSSQNSGWRDWSLERDCTVSGELVTPVLTDTEHDWRAIDTACQAIRDGRGTTHFAGSHTNISCDDYTPEAGWRLAHLMRAHEDDLFRMGRTRGSSREMDYAYSVREPGPQWTNPDSRYINSGHQILNLQDAFNGPGHSRIEFRFPDASHQPGVIQAQVRLCAAMTNYVRTRDVDPSAHRPRGTANSEGWGGRAMAGTAEEFAQHTASVRSFIDSLTTTDRDRIQLAMLWGRGNYHR